MSKIKYVLSSGEELSSKNFNRLFERICRINQLRVVDGTGTERCVQARYIKEYPVGNNDWGDFQTHRRLLGLITVCKFSICLLSKYYNMLIKKKKMYRFYEN